MGKLNALFKFFTIRCLRRSKTRNIQDWMVQGQLMLESWRYLSMLYFYCSSLWKGSVSVTIHSLDHVFISHRNFLLCFWCRPLTQWELVDLTIGCCQMVTTLSTSAARCYLKETIQLSAFHLCRFSHSISCTEDSLSSCFLNLRWSQLWVTLFSESSYFYHQRREKISKNWGK